MTIGLLAASSAAPLPETYPEWVLYHQPLGYWRLGESSGTVAYDSSGHGRHGSYVNGPPGFSADALINGESDTSVDFDGALDYVLIADDPAWDTDEITVEAWVNADSGGNIIMARWGSSASNKCWGLDHLGASSTARFYIQETDGEPRIATGTTTLNTGQTYHVVGTFDGIYARVYVDGTLEGTSSAVNDPWNNETNDQEIRLGHRSDSAGSTRWDGRLDEMAIYDRALSATDILAHYQAGAAV